MYFSNVHTRRLSGRLLRGLFTRLSAGLLCVMFVIRQQSIVKNSRVKLRKEGMIIRSPNLCQKCASNELNS